MCQGLDEEDATRCSLESIYESSYSKAFRGLVGMLQQVVAPTD